MPAKDDILHNIIQARMKMPLNTWLKTGRDIIQNYGGWVWLIVP